MNPMEKKENRVKLLKVGFTENELGKLFRVFLEFPGMVL